MLKWAMGGECRGRSGEGGGGGPAARVAREGNWQPATVYGL